jgi:hypothetical protein
LERPAFLFSVKKTGRLIGREYLKGSRLRNFKNPGKRRSEMKLKTFMIITAIVAAVFGIAFVLATGQVIRLYGNEPTPIVNYVGKLFGGSLFAFAVLLWWARNITDPIARRAIVLSLLVADVIGFIVSLAAQLGGVVNALGWSTVGIYLFFSIGFAYFLFAKTAS